jgi:hypothetical protein
MITRQPKHIQGHIQIRLNRAAAELSTNSPTKSRRSAATLEGAYAAAEQI